MKQDGKEFSLIIEGKPESLLQQAADGELVLFAAARRHTAMLHAFPWAVAPKQSSPRGCAACLVPIMPELANDLLCFPDSQLKMYLAIDPTDCPDAHPRKDHYWVLDEPQTVTREQLYSQAAPAAKVKALPVTTPKAGTNEKTWDDARLRTLWEESIMPGVTQTSLATKHGVTRQRIAALIKTAKVKFSATRAYSGVKNAYGQLIK
ncbi:MAG: hypothetical protein Q7U78_10880 [Gallionella sp.]|nr:hypothetical protein [Gallionella sp.]